ncbi:MAG: YigZ family protein [Clostridia bacterium]|nr:YigZ family protein [Clostridia bacterium]
MASDELYITLEREASASFVEKKSEFIGYAAPCKTEEDALAFIARIRKKHADARHNVYAYMLKENNIARFTDDGEPQGTAGLPVLDIIRKTGFTDACIVVTRYFGGVLLGTGGLVRAYSHAAKLAAEEAHIITYERFAVCDIICDYADYDKIRSGQALYGIVVDGVEYAQDVTQHIAIRASEYNDMCLALTELTNGAVLIERTGDRYDYLKNESSCRKTSD